MLAAVCLAVNTAVGDCSRSMTGAAFADHSLRSRRVFWSSVSVKPAAFKLISGCNPGAAKQKLSNCWKYELMIEGLGPYVAHVAYMRMRVWICKISMRSMLTMQRTLNVIAVTLSKQVADGGDGGS